MRIGVLLRAEDAGAAPAREALSLALSLGGEATTYILAARPGERYLAAGSLLVGESADLADPDLEQLYRAARRLLGQSPPELLLMPEGPLFEAIGARLAGSLGRSALREVSGISLEGPGITVGKAAFGGKAQIEVAGGAGAVLSLRAGAFAAGDLVAAAAEVVALGDLPQAMASRTVVRDAGGDDLGSARVIVSGGRGLGSREAYEGLQELAGMLGGALGASRAAVDEGWAAPTKQVGLTGQKVAPQLYLAIGISGASQHLSGIAGAKTVIAVNRDEKAPIFEAADIGVVADWHELWPLLRRALGG